MPKFIVGNCSPSPAMTLSIVVLLLIRSTTSPTCLAADLYVLLLSTVWQYLRSSWQPSLTNRAFPV